LIQINPPQLTVLTGASPLKLICGQRGACGKVYRRPRGSTSLDGRQDLACGRQWPRKPLREIKPSLCRILVHKGSHSFQRPKTPSTIRPTANSNRNTSNIVTRSIWLRGDFPQARLPGGYRSRRGSLHPSTGRGRHPRVIIVAQDREFLSVRHNAGINVGTDRRSCPLPIFAHRLPP
jgi:hypothetical protein